MDEKEVMKVPSMPAASPSYPVGPYKFYDREFFVIIYKSCPKAIRKMVPEPLVPNKDNIVLYEFMKMPDSPRFGSFAESGQVIPCTYKGKNVNFTVQMFLNCSPPIYGGREIWGFPKKYANPSLRIEHDTLVGKLEYGNELVSLGTMGYKFNDMLNNDKASYKKNVEAIKKKLQTMQVNLKIIPDVDGSDAIRQLIGYHATDITVKEAWSGPARLHLVPHVNAPLADLPVEEVDHALHFLCDLTLPYGKVLYDYLKKGK